IFAVLAIGFAVFLHATRGGRALYAIGNNREAARFSGIAVKRGLLGLFVTSGVMCSVAAIVLTAYLASARSDTASGLELQVITAVAVQALASRHGDDAVLQGVGHAGRPRPARAARQEQSGVGEDAGSGLSRPPPPTGPFRLSPPS